MVRGSSDFSRYDNYYSVSQIDSGRNWVWLKTQNRVVKWGANCGVLKFCLQMSNWSIELNLLSIIIGLLLIGQNVCFTWLQSD